MDPVIVTSTVTALATTVATKSLESPLKTINDLWDGSIGHTVAAWSEKRRIQAFQNVENLKQNIADEANKIPIENIQEPQISIIGPALEASKYYIDEKELRLMFAKIIAASMDSRKNGYIHHSFVEIIKQLAPLDAKILASIDKDESAPIININKVHKNKSFKTAIHYDFFLFHNNRDNTLNSISINNLKRLGLVNIDYQKHLTDDKLYSLFENTDEYLALKRDCKINGDSDLDIEKGIIILTNFGKSFTEICLS